MSKLDIRIEPCLRAAPAALPDPLGFGRHFTARMFTRRYSAGRGWHDARIGPYQPLALDPAAQVFHCGAGEARTRLGTETGRRGTL